MIEEKQIHIELYTTTDGNIPFLEWLDGLKNRQDRARIRVRLDRIALGNFGDHKSVGDGVHELRMTFGPGYRVYYGREGSSVTLLLCGGNKSSQKNDIKLAKCYWKDHLRGNDYGQSH